MDWMVNGQPSHAGGKQAWGRASASAVAGAWGRGSVKRQRPQGKSVEATASSVNVRQERQADLWMGEEVGRGRSAGRGGRLGLSKGCAGKDGGGRLARWTATKPLRLDWLFSLAHPKSDHWDLLGGQDFQKKD